MIIYFLILISDQKDTVEFSLKSVDDLFIVLFLLVCFFLGFGGKVFLESPLLVALKIMFLKSNIYIVGEMK